MRIGSVKPQNGESSERIARHNSVTVHSILYCAPISRNRKLPEISATYPFRSTFPSDLPAYL